VVVPQNKLVIQKGKKEWIREADLLDAKTNFKMNFYAISMP